MNAKERHQDRAEGVRAACTAASPADEPSSSFWARESTIRIAFLAGQADKYDETDLRQDIDRQPSCEQAAYGCEQAHRHD